MLAREEVHGAMNKTPSGIKACECGHGKAIHVGTHQPQRIGTNPCNFPGCGCAQYKPVRPGQAKGKTKS